MNINNGVPDKSPTALELVRFKVICLPYSEVKRIACMGDSDSSLKLMFKKVHGIEIENLFSDPPIYFIYSSDTDADLKRSGVAKPSMALMLGNAQAFGLTKEQAVESFKKQCATAEEERQS